MSEWRESKLGNLVVKIIDNRGKNPPYSSHGYEVIETSCISGVNKYPDYSVVKKYVSQECYNHWFRAGHPQKGDIVIISVGNGIGNVCIMSDNRGVLTQNLIGLRIDESIVDSNFIYYYLSWNTIQDYLKCLNIGSAQPSIKVPHLLSTPIPLPSLPEQRAIASVLSSLDDKIDLLHRQNKTLEALAQTFWRKMFVEDADPNWEITKMSEIIDVRDGTHDSPKPVEIGFYLITSRHLKENDIDYRNAYKISLVDYTQINKRSKVNKHDILFSMIGTLGLIYYVDEEPSFAIKNIGLFKSSEKPEFAKYLYLMLKSPVGKDFIFKNSDGSTQEYISLGNLRAFCFSYPGINAIKDFNEIIEPFFYKIFQNKKQIRTLSHLRDTLLPKLMSGEVRVKL